MLEIVGIGFHFEQQQSIMAMAALLLLGERWADGMLATPTDPTCYYVMLQDRCDNIVHNLANNPVENRLSPKLTVLVLGELAKQNKLRPCHADAIVLDFMVEEISPHIQYVMHNADLLEFINRHANKSTAVFRRFVVRLLDEVYMSDGDRKRIPAMSLLGSWINDNDHESISMLKRIHDGVMNKTFKVWCTYGEILFRKLLQISNQRSDMMLTVIALKMNGPVPEHGLILLDRLLDGSLLGGSLSTGVTEESYMASRLLERMDDPLASYAFLRERPRVLSWLRKYGERHMFNRLACRMHLNTQGYTFLSDTSAKLAFKLSSEKIEEMLIQAVTNLTKSQKNPSESHTCNESSVDQTTQPQNDASLESEWCII